MARYRACVDTPLSPEEAFAFLSDFSTTQEWDPGVVEAERLDEGALSAGSEFRLVADFLGRKTALTYRVIEFDPPRAVTVRAENLTVVSLDRITFDALGEGTRVTYDADLRLKRPLRPADPLLVLAFNRIGDAALAGLRRTIGHPGARHSAIAL
ncbi:MAG: SRPBCC family protein [Solirubrobacteraceae bacterium]|jgi:carbon monoxide dehydrogenase subunit G